MAVPIQSEVHQALQTGVVIPACPLALNTQRRLDERRQRALVRYYSAAGAGGLAVGVHTTQFAIREPKNGLFKPVLELAAAELGLLPSAPKAAQRMNRPSPDPSQEGSKRSSPPHPFPSWEGLGVGSSDRFARSSADSTHPASAVTNIGIAGVCGHTRQ